MRRLIHRHWKHSLIVVLVAGLIPPSAIARTSTCPELIKPQSPVRSVDASSASSGQLTAVSRTGTDVAEATLVMNFGTNRNRDVRTQTYRLSDGMDPSHVRVSTINDIVNGNDPLPIANQQLTYRAGPSPTTGLVNVRVCYDPGAQNEPAPGRYVGALLVSAPGAKPVPLAVELTFRDTRVWLTIAALLVGILAGIVLQAITTFQQAPKSSRPKAIWPYVFNFRALVGLGVGVVAAFTAYGNLVEGDATWRVTAPSLLALAGATFGAVVVGKTATDLKSPTEKERSKGLAV